jgi:polyisoprenoid-binding protein YceI
MKKTKIILLSALLSLLNFNSFAEPFEYKIESNHAFVLWSANHFGFSDQYGKFSDIAGKIIFDEKKPENSSVDVEIKISSLSTGLTKFDEHLKSADFFDEKKFPTAKFVSKKVVLKGKKGAEITGDLTIKGVTKSVVLKTKFNKSGVNPISQKETIGFSAKTKIKRSEFGMDYALPAVSDKVDLIIEVEANR